MAKRTSTGNECTQLTWIGASPARDSRKPNASGGESGFDILQKRMELPGSFVGSVSVKYSAARETERRQNLRANGAKPRMVSTSNK